MVEGARLLSEWRVISLPEGSNPSLSARCVFCRPEAGEAHRLARMKLALHDQDRHWGLEEVNYFETIKSPSGPQDPSRGNPQ